jgi:hypothetical protein
MFDPSASDEAVTEPGAPVAGLSAHVAGTSALFPRGYLWIAPLWYAAAAIVLAIAPWPPVWFRLGAAAGLLLALITFLAVLSSVSITAFGVDQGGIRLGLPAGTTRRGRWRRQSKWLTWAQVERVRIIGEGRNVRLELILSPAAFAAIRPARNSAAHQAAKWIPLALIPFWYLRWPTALISPLERPARYAVRLRDVTVDELRPSLRALAPPEVAVSVLMRSR